MVTFLFDKRASPSAQGIQESATKYIENMSTINFTGVKVGFFNYKKKANNKMTCSPNYLCVSIFLPLNPFRI